ncbi:MAG TPA: hypothetical protein VN915_01590 [Elusimicrobiota bacterium]|nr:hypothetical protein [Elusimicrobiota bacterium]
MRAATLIAVLAVLPASAATLKPASCLKATKFGPAPKTFEDFRDCQAGAREDLVSAAESKGKPLTANQLDQIDETQRAEARKFMAQPKLVTTGPAPDASAPAASGASPNGKLGGVSSSDLKRVDAASGASLAALQERLHAAAGDGKDGITPAMADDIRTTLTQMQGSLSPDMQNLLGALQKDGGKLTPDTMKLIQGAAQSAKGSGLNLNIDPSMEKDILNHDFEADKPAFNAQNPPASN